PDPVGEAVAALRDRRLRVVDLDDHICGRTECAGAVGGVVVYFDGSHLTATFARTLAPYLNVSIRRALDAA
ncbi:MAG TPA: SGNH hydrolase domain-containing protein, partial [Sporichthyaceae bacterium]|nr:SGNH hydrolase domain-containing protein [Sporichthyaceae bacterium]